MSRIIELEPRKVELLEPHEAGRLDPPMQDWLQLPVGDPGCPNGHPYFGTKNPIGYFPVRYCKECRMEFRGKVDARTIQRVVDALCGTPIRLGR